MSLFQPHIIGFLIRYFRTENQTFFSFILKKFETKISPKRTQIINERLIFDIQYLSNKVNFELEGLRENKLLECKAILQIETIIICFWNSFQ